MSTKTLAQHIWTALIARENCRKNGNNEWFARWDSLLDSINEILPSGSGLDSGTTISGYLRSSIHLTTSYHHMDTHGGYDGWTEHTVIIEPAFEGLNIRITGRNRNDIKDSLIEIFDYALTEQWVVGFVDGDYTIEREKTK